MSNGGGTPTGGGSIPWPWSNTSAGGDMPFPLSANSGLQLFQPQLSLSWDATTKHYTLKAVTLVPSGHYSAAAGQDGATPPGVMIIPETHAVTLPISFNPAPATQAFKILKHEVELSGATQGHHTVTAFVVLAGALVGANSIGLPNSGQHFFNSGDGVSLTATSFAMQAGVAPSKIPGPSWAAWINNMPGSPRALHVIGSVTVPNPGVLVGISRAIPQGFNPSILILELHFTQLPGMWPMVMTTRPIHYEEALYRDNHTDCSIRLPSGASVNIPIDIVS